MTVSEAENSILDVDDDRLHDDRPRATPGTSPSRTAVIAIAVSIAGISVAHYLTPTDWELLHNLFQRLYYVPIIWAAYRFESRGGLLAAIFASVLYAPHILITWRFHHPYQVSQLFEIAMFLGAGYFIGRLFEQKTMAQQMVRSLERMAQFGNLARSVIRPLKSPIKSIRGMLITLRTLARSDASTTAAVDIIEKQIEAIEKVRGDLISLVARRNLRLKRLDVNKVMTQFLAQVEVALLNAGVTLHRQQTRHQLKAFLHAPALTEALHELFSLIAPENDMPVAVTAYTGHTSKYVWLGATIDSIYLTTYYTSGLSTINTITTQDYQLVHALNIVNAHCGDMRLRYRQGRLAEFIIVLPKKLRLPWYLQDQQARFHRVASQPENTHS